MKNFTDRIQIDVRPGREDIGEIMREAKMLALRLSAAVEFEFWGDKYRVLPTSTVLDEYTKRLISESRLLK